MSEKDIHVVFERGKWSVFSGVSEEHCQFNNKNEAEKHAKQRAQILKSPVIIHDKSGGIEQHDISELE